MYVPPIFWCVLHSKNRQVFSRLLQTLRRESLKIHVSLGEPRTHDWQVSALSRLQDQSVCAWNSTEIFIQQFFLLSAKHGGSNPGQGASWRRVKMPLSRHTPCPLRSPPARNVTPVHLFQLHISGGPLYINRCKEILGRVLDTGQGLYAEMTVQRKCASRFALEGRSEQLKVKRKCGWAGNQVERSGKTRVFLLEPWFLKCGTAAVASPESLLEMQILGSQPRPPRVWAQRSVV